VQNKLGYYFYPRRYLDAPGHPQLDIVLRPSPTGRHFDPEWVSLEVISGQDEIEHLSVHHPWRWLGYHFHLRPGQVTWGDRKGKTVSAFTFGGKLHIHSEKGCTICSLTSRAPILHANRRFSIPRMLAVEVEVLLAERRTVWLHDLAAFKSRLNSTEPLALYHACLKALKEKFEELALQPESEFLHQFFLFLYNEIERRDGVWNRGVNVPKLSELL
jgi:hypothetical protein